MVKLSITTLPELVTKLNRGTSNRDQRSFVSHIFTQRNLKSEIFSLTGIDVFHFNCKHFQNLPQRPIEAPAIEEASDCLYHIFHTISDGFVFNHNSSRSCHRAQHLFVSHFSYNLMVLYLIITLPELVTEPNICLYHIFHTIWWFCI